jgi:hypothetical protein
MRLNRRQISEPQEHSTSTGLDRVLQHLPAFESPHASPFQGAVIRGLVGLKPTDPASENVRKQIVSGEI